MGELLDIKSINEMTKKGFVEIYKEKMKEVFTHDWYFCGWEKIIIVGTFIWTVWSILHWIYGVLAW